MAAATQGRWVIRDLGTLGGDSSYAVAINDRGQVIGQATTKSGERVGFLWQTGKIRHIEFDPKDINERGQVVGSVHARAFLWQNGKMRDLGENTEAIAINERGQVIGRRWVRAVAHAVLWTYKP